MMISAFGGLHIATSALMAYQRAMDTVSHNVSNAGTPGYSRQRVDLAARVHTQGADMNTVFGWRVGEGVDVVSISRARDLFLDTHFRAEASRLGNWESMRDSLSRVEGALAGLTDASITTALDEYWNSWHDVANQPESTAIRRQLLQRGQTLASLLNRNYEQLNQERADLNQQIRDNTADINQIASSIADLNAKIRNVTAQGISPNDLLDQRDSLLDKLSKLTDTIVRTAPNGQLNVFIGSKALVREDTAIQIVSTTDLLTGDELLTWSDDGSSIQFGSGVMKGLLDSRDTFIPRYRQKLDDFASQLITSTNALHSAGFGLDDSTGNDFFTGTDAATIAVNAVLNAAPEKVAASATMSTPGNNDVAMAILGLRSQRILAGNTETFDSFLRSITVDLGADIRYAETMVAHQENLTLHLEGQRAELMGVNVDEELTNMVQFQRSFQAAARLVTAQDEMLDTLINRLGVVGR